MCHQLLLVLPVPHSFCGMTADYSPVGVSPVVTWMPFFISGQAIKQGENKNILGFVFNSSLYMVLLVASLRLKRTLKKPA